MKFSIVIPIYNERPTAGLLLEQVLAVELSGVEKEIVVVEGGSTDGTRELMRDFEARGVRVIYEDAPRGKGAAVRRGLAEISGDVILIQDGDLEYKVSDYPALLKPLQDGICDVVYGSRAMSHSQRWQYRQYHSFERFYGFFVNFGGVLFTGMFNLLYGTKLTDGATMFKLFTREALSGIALKSRGFDYDWEIAAKLAKKGCRFYEVPITYKARSRAEGKKIRFWRDGTAVLLAILRYRFTN